MVNNRKALDPRWVTQTGALVADDFQTATIRVFRKGTGQKIYNQATRTWTTDGTVIYEGKARLQPYGIIRDELVAQDPTGKRLMRVQVSTKLSDIKLDDYVDVIASPDAPELLLYEMYVRGSISSSVAWLTDLVVVANLKHA